MTILTSKLAQYAFALMASATIATLPIIGTTTAMARDGAITTFTTNDPDDLISSFSKYIGGRGTVKVCIVNNGSDREPKKVVLAAGPTSSLTTISLYAKFRGSTRCKTIDSKSIYKVKFYKSGNLVHTGRFTARNWDKHQVVWKWKND